MDFKFFWLIVVCASTSTSMCNIDDAITSFREYCIRGDTMADTVADIVVTGLPLDVLESLFTELYITIVNNGIAVRIRNFIAFYMNHLGTDFILQRIIHFSKYVKYIYVKELLAYCIDTDTDTDADMGYIMLYGNGEIFRNICLMYPDGDISCIIWLWDKCGKMIDMRACATEIFTYSCKRYCNLLTKWLWNTCAPTIITITEDAFINCFIRCNPDKINWIHCLVPTIDICAQDNQAFKYCCFNNHLDMAKKMWNYAIKRGTPINIHTCDEIIFRYCCEYDLFEMVVWLWTISGESIDIHACDEEAFVTCSRLNNIRIILFLFSISTINISARDNYAFKICMKCGYEDLAKAIYQYSREIWNEIDIGSEEYFVIAYANGRMCIAEWLWNETTRRKLPIQLTIRDIDLLTYCFYVPAIRYDIIDWLWNVWNFESTTIGDIMKEYDGTCVMIVDGASRNAIFDALFWTTIADFDTRATAILLNSLLMINNRSSYATFDIHANDEYIFRYVTCTMRDIHLTTTILNFCTYTNCSIHIAYTTIQQICHNKDADILTAVHKYSKHAAIVTIDFHHNNDELFKWACTESCNDIALIIFYACQENGTPITIYNEAFICCCKGKNIEMIKWLWVTTRNTSKRKMSLDTCTDNIVDLHYNNDEAFKICCVNDDMVCAEWIYNMTHIEYPKTRIQIDIGANDHALFRECCDRNACRIAKWLCTLNPKYRIEINESTKEIINYRINK